MLKISANDTQLTVVSCVPITSDSIGVPCEISLSPEYDGLAVTLVFKAGDVQRDVALLGNPVYVPAECLEQAGEVLMVGLWAGDGSGIPTIRTVWTSAGIIREGVISSGIDPSTPEPDWAAQVQQYAQDAHDTAERLAAEVDGWETEIDAAVQGAETATATAQAAASSASSAATSATNAASAASTAAGQASAAAGAATDAASEATGAAASATAAAADATEAAGLADNATAAANAAASNAETATREAIAATTGANTAAATANAAAGSASTAASSATTAAGTATDAAASATSAASAAGTAATAANTAATAANTAAEAATEAAEGIAVAYFPGLAVGSADGILGGGPIDEFTWLARACPGSDGPARIESIHGRTLAWNQLADNGNFANGTYLWAARESTLTVADGVATATPTSDGTARGLQASSTMGTAVAGHKYLISTEFNTNEATNLNLSFSGSSPVTVVVPSTGVWHKCAAIWTNSNVTSVRPYLLTATNVTTSAQLKYRNIKIFDLTQMFGAGNEPSTVAEFEALFPEPYYPYNAGILLSVNLTGVESVGDGWAFERTIPAATYFPNGMRSAGSICDELTEHEAIHRVGEAVIDGSTPIWVSYSDGAYMRFAISSIPSAGGEIKADRATYTPTLATLDTITNGISTGGVSNRIYFTLTANETTVELASQYLAEHPITIHYPLDTPTTTPIDPALNLTYKAAAGGTERVMHDEPTAPPTLVVQYGSTADGIRDRAVAAIANPDGPVAQSNHAIGTYLTMGGTLYKVTRAIAVGETIVPGTNVTATTVMAEVMSAIADLATS